MLGIYFAVYIRGTIEIIRKEVKKIMKRFLIIALALGLAVAFTGMVIAAEPATPAKKEATKEEVFRGTVVSVDAVANTIVVNNKKANKEETFQVDSKTKIQVAGKEKKLADIKKDQKVAVHYRVEGDKKIATLIR
jgi:alpha-glucosidase (family GH31 glycosyl hydrolase)